MNSLELIYTSIPSGNVVQEVEAPNLNSVYKFIRRELKPKFANWKLKANNANNANGTGAQGFNRRIGRFKFDWLDFEILDYVASPNDFLSESQLNKLIRDTAVANSSEWRGTIEKQIAEGKTYLLVGMEAILAQDQFRPSMLTRGLPPNCWPCRFKIFELVVTNAPACQFILHRPHVIV